MAYLVTAAIIYSFLTPGFPGNDAVLVLGVAILGLAAATAADILPGERYVVHKFDDRGRIRDALWTLVLAAFCVLISRLSGMQPGFMYGVIGTFVFVAALGATDEGRMEARGAMALLALAVVAWFARIRSSPRQASGVRDRPDDNLALVGIFVVAVEGLVFGLIPLSFLPGETGLEPVEVARPGGRGPRAVRRCPGLPGDGGRAEPDPSSLDDHLVQRSRSSTGPSRSASGCSSAGTTRTSPARASM